jgi:hypothetical protein
MDGSASEKHVIRKLKGVLREKPKKNLLRKLKPFLMCDEELNVLENGPTVL